MMSSWIRFSQQEESLDPSCIGGRPGVCPVADSHRARRQLELRKAALMDPIHALRYE